MRRFKFQKLPRFQFLNSGANEVYRLKLEIVPRGQDDDEEEEEMPDEEEEPEEDDEEEMLVNVSGVIGSEVDQLDAGSFVRQLQGHKGPIRLRINTPGGMVFDALDVYDALVSHKAAVTADIVGQSWSSGTILTAAADKVRIREAARFGVHRAWTGLMLIGNEEDIGKQINQVEADIESLRSLDQQIAKLLADRSGNSLEQVHEWMVGPEGVDGTEWTGQAAVDIGFADELLTNKRKTKRRQQRQLNRALIRQMEIAERRRQQLLHGSAY